MKKSFFWQRFRRKFFQHIWLTRVFVAGAVLVLIVGLLAVAAKPALDIAAKVLIGPRMIAAFFVDPSKVLKSTNKRMNLLLLGIAGGDHEGSDLTDTMIFSSVDLETGDVVLLSIPRDIWLESLKAKINTAYYYGEEKAENGGFVLAKDAVYQITNQPINYAILLDFAGFQKAIDLVGGIDVLVERPFVDEKYPIPGKENDECNGDKEYKCRYEALNFEKGLEHMGGETALKFVRSRNAESEEGTDFARSQRQQKVMLAFKDKLLSKKILLSPGTLFSLKKTFSQHVKFDKEISEEEMSAFLSLFWRFTRGNNTLRTLTLDTGTDESPGFLTNPPVSQYGQWVLAPRAGGWQEFQEYLRQKLANVI